MEKVFLDRRQIFYGQEKHSKSAWLNHLISSACLMCIVYRAKKKCDSPLWFGRTLINNVITRDYVKIEQVIRRANYDSELRREKSVCARCEEMIEDRRQCWQQAKKTNFDKQVYEYVYHLRFQWFSFIRFLLLLLFVVWWRFIANHKFIE